MDVKGTLGVASTLSLKKGASNETTLSAHASSTSHILTLPQLTAADQLVSRTSTDTMTNKTLTSPVLTTPTLGVATATSINKVAITAPASGATLTLADGKTLTVSNTLTFTGTDSSSVAFGAGGTVAYTGNKLSAFAATTSAELAGVISDETGTGALVFAESPTLVTPALGTPASGVMTNVTGLPLTTGVTGTLPLGNGGTGQTTASAAFGALSPLTTKGDILTYSTANARLAVGTDGQVLTADSAQTTGLKWSSPLTNPMAAQGDMIYGGASGAATKLATGATAGVLHGGNGATPTWSAIVNADVDAAAAIAGSKLQAAGTGNAGAVTTAAQSFAGAKTFTSTITVGGNTTSDSNLGTISSVSLGSYYYGTFTYAFNGVGFNATQTPTISYVKVGRVVTLTFPSTLAACSGSTPTNITGTGPIPSALWPAQLLENPCAVYDNGAQANAGKFYLNTSGVIKFFKSLNETTTFAATSAQNIGWGGFTVSYVSAT